MLLCHAADCVTPSCLLVLLCCSQRQSLIDYCCSSMAEASAGASIQLGDVQQSTKCPICLDAFKDPRGLPCKHTYCLQCLHSLQQSNMSKMRCPVCKQLTVPYKDQLDSLPKNEFAEELVRLMHRFENAPVTPAAGEWIVSCITGLALQYMNNVAMSGF